MNSLQSMYSFVGEGSSPALDAALRVENRPYQFGQFSQLSPARPMQGFQITNGMAHGLPPTAVAITRKRQLSDVNVPEQAQATMVQKKQRVSESRSPNTGVEGLHLPPGESSGMPSTSTPAIDVSVVDSAHQAMVQLEDALKRDLKHATLPPDVLQQIVNQASYSLFHEQHRHWSTEFSNTRSLDNILTADGTSNGLECDLRQQADLLGKCYDRNLGAIIKKGISSQKLDHYKQQKPTTVDKKHRSILSQWAMAWKQKQPGDSYMIKEQAGKLANDALPRTKQIHITQIEPSKTVHSSGSNASGTLKHSVPNTHVARTNTQTPAPGFVNSSTTRGHSLTGAAVTTARPHVGDGGSQIRAGSTYYHEAPTTAGQLSSETPILLSSSASTATALTNNQIESTLASVNASCDAPPKHKKTQQPDDIFKGYKSSLDSGLVGPSTPMLTIMNLYPNHLVLHDVAIRMVDENWSITEVVHVLKEHKVVDEKKSEYEGNVEKLWQWVKRQREKACHHRRNGQKAEAKKLGYELPKKFTKVKGSNIQKKHGSATKQKPAKLGYDSATNSPFATPSAVPTDIARGYGHAGSEHMAYQPAAGVQGGQTIDSTLAQAPKHLPHSTSNAHTTALVSDNVNQNYDLSYHDPYMGYDAAGLGNYTNESMTMSNDDAALFNESHIDPTLSNPVTALGSINHTPGYTSASYDSIPQHVGLEDSGLPNTFVLNNISTWNAPPAFNPLGSGNVPPINFTQANNIPTQDLNSTNDSHTPPAPTRNTDLDNNEPINHDTAPIAPSPFDQVFDDMISSDAYVPPTGDLSNNATPQTLTQNTTNNNNNNASLGVDIDWDNDPEFQAVLRETYFAIHNNNT